jgi:hypothetical protein
MTHEDEGKVADSGIGGYKTTEAIKEMAEAC